MKDLKSERPINENMNRKKAENKKKEYRDSNILKTKESVEEQETRRSSPVLYQSLTNKSVCLNSICLFSVSPLFLDLAKAAAAPVVRILSKNFGFKGTGFMISDKLLLTNSHVIPNILSAEKHFVEFNYELGTNGSPKPVTRFLFAPHKFFVASSFDDLDFAIIAIGDRILGKGTLSEFGYCPLTNIQTQNVQEINCIIHHPRGDFKRLTFFSKIVAQTDEVSHYYAETQSGSSGAPVFNTNFELIAMHHYATPSRIAFTKDGQLGPKDINEGVRVGAIIKRISEVKHKLSKSQRTLIETALSIPFKQSSFLNHD